MHRARLYCGAAALLILAGCSASTPSQPTAAVAPSSVDRSGTASAMDASEQVVFSGVASMNSTFAGGASVAFEIHCEAESENRNAGKCNGGSLSFSGLGIIRHVTGTSAEEDDSDLYTLTVASADGDVSCQLSNAALPVQGPHNVVLVTCQAPAGSAESDTAIVHVTGPAE